VKALARRLGVRHESVAVVFGDDAMLADLNRRFRRKDRTTDVLSFPAGDGIGGPASSGHLGDIAISSEAARRQARRAGHTPSREASFLLIHGFLHLIGYDHEVDDGQMVELERTMRWEMLGKGVPAR
jgi:probable rRNA maturation factor